MNGKMPWFRMYSESIYDVKFNRIARETRLSKIAVIGAWTVFLSLASESPARGDLLVTLQERFTISDIAEVLEVDELTTERLIEEFTRMGMIALVEGHFTITNWGKRQFTSDNVTERVKKHREREECNVSETLHRGFDSVSDSVSLIKDSLNTGTISDFGVNGSRDCEKLYQKVTGQITFPSSRANEAIQDLTTVLDHYKTVDAAVPDGKKTFAKWCSTQGKTGKMYSRTNIGWLSWWLDEIAPRPEKAQKSLIERLLGESP